jgi:hypothetical protein
MSLTLSVKSGNGAAPGRSCGRGYGDRDVDHVVVEVGHEGSQAAGDLLLAVGKDRASDGQGDSPPRCCVCR